MLRRIIIAGGAFFLILFMAAVAAAVFLDSTAGGDFLLGRARGSLPPELGVRLDYQSGHMRLLHGFEFNGLHLEVHRPELEALVDIPRMSLAYQISLLARRLDVDYFLVTKPRVRVKAKWPEATAKAAETPSPLSVSLIRMLARPSAEVSVKNVRVSELDLALDLNGQGRSMAVRVPELNFSTQGELAAGKALSSGEFELVKDMQVKGDGPGLVSRIGGKAKWRVELVRSPQGLWSYAFELGDVDVLARDTEFRQNGSATKWTSARLTADGSVLAGTRDSGEWDGVEKADFKAKVEISHPETAQAGSAVKMANAVMGLRAKLAEKLTGEAELSLERMDASGKLTRPVNLVWLSQLSSNRDLREMEIGSLVKLDKTKIIDLKMVAERLAKSLTFKGGCDLTGTATLAALAPSAAVLRSGPELHMTFDGDADKDLTIHFNSQTKVPRFRMATSAPSDGRAGKPAPSDGRAGRSAPVSAAPEIEARLTERATWDHGRRKLDLAADLTAEHESFGIWRARSQVEVATAPALYSKGTTELAREARGKQGLPFEIGGPVSVRHEITLTGDGRKDIHIQGGMPAVNLKDGSRFADVHLKADVRTLDAGGKNLEISASVSQGPIHLAALKGRGDLSGLNLQIKGLVKEEMVSFPVIEMEIDRSLLNVKAEASGNLKAKDMQIRGEAHLKVPENFPLMNGQKLSGEVTVPIALSLFRGREVTVQSIVGFKNLSWSNGESGVTQISGRIPVNERLLWDGKNVRFAQLITENPFERVDFNRVRPLIRGSEQLRVEKLNWKDKIYGPFIGFMSLRQNMVSIHQFDLDLGGGRVYGEFFLNFHPANLQAGFLGRLTSLNLTEFLPTLFVRGADAKSRELSARAGLVFNLNRSTLDGRMDVTEIGGRQLSAMINVLDPNFRDEKMNKIRSLLQVGYPTAVNAAFAEGYMDMDVELNLLSFMARESVHGIPLSSFIAKATAPLREQIAKGALQ